MPLEETNLASTKRTNGDSKRKGQRSTERNERPRIKSSHAGAPQTAAKSAKPKPKGRAQAQKVVGEVTRSARLGDSAPRREPKKKGTRATEIVSTASDAARELSIQVAIAALEKKAVGLEILDVAGRVDYADFLVLMSGRSDRHVIALAQSIEEALKKHGQRPLAVEGLPHATWVLIDYGDVVVHVFQEDRRHLYNLEGLWMDARRIPLPAEEGAPTS